MTAMRGRVLLIEDNPGDARLLAETLKDVPGSPFELVHADLVSSALERLDQERFEAILLDLSLPDGQGFDVLRRLLDVAPSIPVLVLTGLNDEQMALHALGAGAQDYLVKGAHDGDFISRAIRYAIQRKQLLERTRVLRDIDQAITSTLDLQEVFAALLGKTAALFPFSAACVQKINHETGALEFVALNQTEENELRFFDWRAFAAAPQSGAPLTLQPAREHLDASAWKSGIALPLRVKDRTWGYLCFFHHRDHEFSAEALEFLSAVAAQTAVAIHNAELYAESVALAEDLRRSNKVKDDFLSIMSHELRTPLNIVMNCAEIMRAGIVGEINPEQADILDRLMSQAKNQLTLVNGILHATRMETEQLTASVEPVNLKDFLEDLKSDYAISFSKVNVEMRWQLEPELPVASLDRDKLRHILENLINNAIKFTDAGAITISARLVAGASLKTGGTGNWLEFAVADTGVGMPADALDVIFEKFCQLDTTSTRIHGGVGIGLYLVNRFATVLGGSVSVQSELGKGSTFTVMLPFMPADEEPQQNANASKITSTG